MSDAELEYRFRIDAWSPGEMPMARLAEYMAGLARLLGETAHVHFVRLEAGSAVLVQTVDAEAAPKVRARLRTVAEGPAAKAAGRLNRLLAEDNATASLRAGGAEILRFPGRDRSESLTYGPFWQAGTLDGMLVRIGGRDETVPVLLQDGAAFHHCNASRDMARELAPHLFGPYLRVRGEGRWRLDGDRRWTMLRFDIEGFTVLDDAPFSEIVERLRAVEGSGWKDIEDPWAELRRLRHGDAG